MEYRRLGRAGTSVSSYALGTMTFGREAREADAFAQMDRYVELGGNFFDTADVYAGGKSEEILGKWFSERPGARGQIVLATKGRFPMGDGPNDVGLSRRHLSAALDASLGRLGTETIDLYQVHAHDPITPIEETLRFLDDAVHAGKIAYVGLSNFTGWQLQKAVDIADFRGLSVPVTLQPQYNLLVREIEWEIVPAVADAGMGMLPWSPLGGGWLTGKYSRDSPPEGNDRLAANKTGMEAYHRRVGLERTWAVIDCLRDIATARGISMAQIALAWLVDRPCVTSVILGARTLEQLEDNLAAADLHLTDDERERLDVASDPQPADYPYGVPGNEQRSRSIAGGR